MKFAPKSHSTDGFSRNKARLPLPVAKTTHISPLPTPKVELSKVEKNENSKVILKVNMLKEERVPVAILQSKEFMRAYSETKIVTIEKINPELNNSIVQTNNQESRLISLHPSTCNLYQNPSTKQEIYFHEAMLDAEH
jgi:hypothetical protein